MIGALFGPMLALGQAIKLGKAGSKMEKSFQKKQSKLGGTKTTNSQDKKVANFVAKKNKQLNAPKTSPFPKTNTPKIGTPKMNVGNQLNTFKKKQSQAIGKGLSNPINYEQKIKNIMGVN